MLKGFATMRARLFALGLVAVVPLIGLLGWNAWQIRQLAREDATEQLQRLLRLVAAEIGRDITAAQHVLHLIGSHPTVRAGSERACAELLGEHKKQIRDYADFAVLDPKGALLCHSAPGEPSSRFVGDREYFVRALDTRAPVVGSPIASRLDGRPVLPIALPLLDPAGRVERVIATGIDLATIASRRGVAPAIEGATFTVWDAAGTVLFRHPDPERFTGRAYPDLELSRAVRGAAGLAVLETKGTDGVERLYAVRSLREFPEAGLYFSLGVARRDLTAEADRAFYRSTLGLALIVALGLALGWFLAERYVRRPIAALDAAQRRLATGDLSVRVPAPDADGELARLLQGFNATAASLERATRTLRVLSEGNRAMLRAQTEQELLDAVCRIAVEAGGYRMAWIGFAQHDEAKSVRVAASHGAEEGFAARLKASWADDDLGRGPAGTAMRTGRACVVRDAARDPAMAPWRDVLARSRLASVFAAPLRANGDLPGALAIYAGEPDAFDAREVELLSEVAEDLAFGVSVLRLRERSAAAEREIRALNADLERRVAERTAELERLHREFLDLYDNAPCGYHSVDENGLIVRMNDTWLRWLGYRREEVVGKMRHPDLMTPESAERFWLEAFPLFKKQGWLKEVEFEYVRKDGTTFPGSLQTSTIYDAEGRYLMSRTTVFDISERKRIEAEIAAKNAELARANEMKSQFLATMSHELRTPLNAIIGFADVLKDGLAGELSAEQKGFVADIHASGRHLLELINDILDLSKVEAGMMTLDAEPVQAPALFENSVRVLAERAMKNRVALSTEIEPGLPPFLADPRKLKQIVYNLLANAVKFTPAGGTVRLSAHRVSRAAIRLPEGVPGLLPAPPAPGPEQFLEIAVRDSGIGIAAEHLERLFRPFSQVDSSLARRSEGTGLGLAMVKSLAELHGGAVGVASEADKGSTFYVWLPLVEAPAVPPRPALSSAPAPAPAPAPGAATQTALVIEDDDGAARVIEGHLRSEGFRTVRAATGEEGLVRAAKERPALITLDIFLPAMDGWAVMERLKANPDLAAIPVVIVSITDDLSHGIAIGATRVLQKPFSGPELRGALAGILAPHGGERPKVLVVDDNRAAVDVLDGYLRQEFAVLRAYGGREAIDAALRLRPDLILLDLMMPEVSGFDVIDALKSRPETASIPVVVVTAKELSAEDRAALNGHVERIVQKAAFDRGEFLTEVRRALGRPAH